MNLVLTAHLALELLNYSGKSTRCRGKIRSNRGMHQAQKSRRFDFAFGLLKDLDTGNIPSYDPSS